MTNEELQKLIETNSFKSLSITCFPSTDKLFWRGFSYSCGAITGAGFMVSVVVLIKEIASIL